MDPLCEFERIAQGLLKATMTSPTQDQTSRVKGFDILDIEDSLNMASWLSSLTLRDCTLGRKHEGPIGAIQLKIL